MSAQQRLAGFYAALEDAGIAPEPGLIRAVGMEEEVGYREARALFSRPDPPRALIAGGNLVLIGILRAVQELGIVIGRDLALIGCDDTDLTRIYHPPITVIHRDLAQMGAMAARVLVDTMQKGGRQVVQLPTQLVIRASSLVPGP
ncbi:substrate-binding domain-containing protein [Litorilinea aerophila]|uniref:Transcriptional regulator LacI/GalR-like sensor domain-containing protein n=1 Tax=Litorilinea aerophila TaxID=1204385 RepID=A0A540VBK4_9CHLR|nr:substrate-binding domain-containing protein [Litorilinea aerophila]MCC9078041.1 substrate-binding domain-containing protein [Litorilinea aerophila]